MSGVIVTGDFICHSYKIGHNGVTAESKFNVITAMWKNITDMITSRFPDVPIMMTFGNNDGLYNYIPPGGKDPEYKGQIMNFLWKTWFEDIPANTNSVAWQDLLKKKSNFMIGGYFDQDIGDNVKVISLNTILWNTHNPYFQGQLEPAWLMMNWLEDVLNANHQLDSGERRKIILMMHIPPGLNYFPQEDDSDPVQVFWKDEFLKAYLQIIKKYQDDILINLGSHIHRASIKAPISQYMNDLDLVLLLTPSISPIYNNNPGFTVMRIEDNFKILDIRSRVF